MADKTVGMLENVPSLHDESLIPVEQSGELMHATGKQFREFAEQAAEQYVDGATNAAERAEAARDSVEGDAAKAKQAATDAAASQKASADSEAKARLYANQTEAAAGGGVASFNGRGGHVMPQSGDYTADMVGARASDWMPTAAEVGAVPTTRKVNNKPLSADISLTAADVGTVNPNVLRNWYFGNPVNQRGQTEYTGSVYGIDGWVGSTAYCTLSVGESCCSFSAGSGNARWKQYLGTFAKGLCTLSIMVRGQGSGSLYFISTSGSYVGLEDCSFTVDSDTWTLFSKTMDTRKASKAIGQLVLQVDYGSTVDILAVKVEFGASQTLATQGSDGTWWLTEVPKKNAELLRCIQSTADSSDTYANKVIYHTGNKPTAADVGAAPAVESTEHPGCYYRTVSGVVEWLNPPMQLGVEYRTTERYGGKPVYVKVVTFGALPSATVKEVEVSTPNKERLVGYFVHTTATNEDVGKYISAFLFSSNKVKITTNSTEVASMNVHVTVHYTKTTD